MRRCLLVLICLLPAFPALAQGIVPAEAPAAELRPVGPIIPAKDESRVYIVQLAGNAAITAGRRPATVRGRSLLLEADHDLLLAQIGAAGGKLYSYRYSFNGFAARLTPAQVAALRASGMVRNIWADEQRRLQTDGSIRFLGLNRRDVGLNDGLGLRGEDVIVAVIDTGVAPGHPALLDTDQRPLPGICRNAWARNSLLGLWLCRPHRQRHGRAMYDSPPPDWNGVCQSGPGFSADSCNHKVIGARFYAEGFLQQHRLDAAEFRSPRDADGHGTHIATLIAGNDVDASLYDQRLGRLRGVAPRARIAVYKACWRAEGELLATCNTSDLARAIDDAVADGVHVINYSIGKTATLSGPDDLALLAATEAGVFAAVAAGNEGPAPGTLASPGVTPWVTTVGASSRPGARHESALRIVEPSSLSGDYAIREAAFTAPLRESSPIAGTLIAVDDGVEQLSDGTPGSVHDACEPLINAADVSGNIALITRGGCEFQTKLLRAQAAGAKAAVVVNDEGPPITMGGENGLVEIPGVMVGAEEGSRLLAALQEGRRVTLDLRHGHLKRTEVAGNVIGDFSSRGPNLAALDLLKPDLTAPGVDILGGYSPDGSAAVGERFQYISGTSQSAPIVAGVAALLRERHPDWTPGMIKSALMTTAYTHDLVKDDETSPADPFDRGAGHIDPNRAVEPGLLYPVDNSDYAAFACGNEPLGHAARITAEECAALAAGGRSFAASDLNLPSIGVSQLAGQERVTRRVTGVGPARVYRAEVNAPQGVEITVEPSQLALGDGDVAEFSVHISGAGEPTLDRWLFGALTWRSEGDEQTAYSPIALRPVALRVPSELHAAGIDGQQAFELRVGYSGAYTPRIHGLRKPLVLEGFVEQDPGLGFSFRSGDGVDLQLIEVPPAQAYARFALLDELTDGDDDLDLYLFYCPTDNCVQVGESGRFDSNEEINLEFPAPGRYAVLVHGFATDPSTGPGANYALLAWSFGIDDDIGNLAVQAPTSVRAGEHVEVSLGWQALEDTSLYLGGISHHSPRGRERLTIVRIDTR